MIKKHDVYAKKKKGTWDGKVFDNVTSCHVAGDKANRFFILSVYLMSYFNFKEMLNIRHLRSIYPIEMLTQERNTLQIVGEYKL